MRQPLPETDYPKAESQAEAWSYKAAEHPALLGLAAAVEADRADAALPQANGSSAQLADSMRGPSIPLPDGSSAEVESRFTDDGLEALIIHLENGDIRWRPKEKLHAGDYPVTRSPKSLSSETLPQYSLEGLENQENRNQVTEVCDAIAQHQQL